MKIPLDFEIRPYARLAALGAVAVSAGTFAIWLLTVFVTRPSHGGGIDNTHFILSLMSVGLICAAVIAVHLAFARQLLRYWKEGHQRHRRS